MAYSRIPVATKNTPFFGYFPKMQYDINNTIANVTGPHETVTDIFVRFTVVKNVINNIASYVVYELQDGDTPEILAEQFYNDRGAGWIILYANQIIDPLFDWPLGYDAFNKMIIDRYGSLENAMSTVHHSEMVIERTNRFYDVTTVSSYVIDNNRRTNDLPDFPYAYYTPWTATTHRTADSDIFKADISSNTTPAVENYEFVDLPLSADVSKDDQVTVYRSGSIATVASEQTYELDGQTIHEKIYGQQVSVYDWELKNNDDKKLIKVIKSEYYYQIMDEFQKMLNAPRFRGL